MLRLLGLLSLGLVLSVLVLGEVGPVIAATLHTEDHVCACPIDGDGHCQCLECYRLDVHGDRDEREQAPRPETGPRWTDGCGTGGALPALASLDPWDLTAPAPTPPSPSPARRPSPACERPPTDPDLPSLDRPPSRG